MGNTIIEIENLGKMYHLGVIGYGTLKDDLRSFWAHLRGKDDPNSQIGKASRIGQHGEFWALRDVSFKIQNGERVGIIGRNGAGKSTLLKIISKITSPTEGRIKVRGRTASLLEVGTGFHPELTGRENVILNGAILGMKRREIQRKFDEIVEFSGISDFIDTPVKRYSSGMYVRLAFSVAAHLDSDILIVDEVLAVGDAEFQKKCLGKMDDVSVNQGRAVLFVSHSLGTVRQLCSRAIILEKGRLVEQGDSENIIASYLNSMFQKNKTTERMNGVGAELQMLNSSGKSVSEFSPGEEITINVHAEFNEPIEDFGLAISISNGYNPRIFTAYSLNQLTNRFSLQKSCDCKVLWKNPYLAPGLYEINLTIYNRQANYAWFNGIATVKIAEADIWGTGSVVSANEYLQTFAKCEWNITTN